MNIKLNKNQKKFFEEAISHFGDVSSDIRLKDINKFAEDRGLIVPTSALKQLCQEEGQVRGHYNLLLSGVEPPPSLPNSSSSPEFNDTTSAIIETSSFVDTPVKKKDGRFNPKGMTPISFRNPIYVLNNSDYDCVAVHETPEGAYENRKLVLHEYGDKEYDEVCDELLYKGRSVINAERCNMWCAIVVMEKLK